MSRVQALSRLRPVSEQQLLLPLETAFAGYGDEANVRSLLGVSTEQYGHYEISQHTRIREVTGNKATRISSVLIEFLNDAEAHVQLAREERSHYRSVVATAKQVVKDTFSVDGQLQVPPVNACLPPASNDITLHFSFDMGQQVSTCTCIQYL